MKKKKKGKIRRERKWRETFFALYFVPTIVKKVKSGKNRHLHLRPLLSNLITANLRGGFFRKPLQFPATMVNEVLTVSPRFLPCHRKPTGFT